ncbi:MAG TPA: GNAT family N-acetyltransferase [Bacilli bacterium]|nr:GNAT family N-acetyltransferase [Bacilli bacterium]
MNACMINSLNWESRKFGINASEIIFIDEINDELWGQIEQQILGKDLVVIKNSTDFRSNSKLIAENTNAILYDTNVTFAKRISQRLSVSIADSNLSIEESTPNDFNEDLTELLDFRHSRFFKDRKMHDYGGKEIYKDWVHNAKNYDNKHLIILRLLNQIVGFLLYSIQKDFLNIELISIHPLFLNKHYGSLMLQHLENVCLLINILTIKVGTQISNIEAMNFYVKKGFSITETIDVYHWWRD